MKDRGMIKWAPFNSLGSEEYLINEIEKKKYYKDLPTLSKDQISKINDNLKKAIACHLQVTIKYYYDGDFITTKSYIVAFNSVQGQLKLLNNKIIYNSQIIDISF